MFYVGVVNVIEKFLEVKLVFGSVKFYFMNGRFGLEFFGYVNN